jgi:hypothetical protein
MERREDDEENEDDKNVRPEKACAAHKLWNRRTFVMDRDIILQ